jgi:hypothetical protein
MNYFEQSGMTANDLSTLSWEDYFQILNYNIDLIDNNHVTPSYFYQRLELLTLARDTFINNHNLHHIDEYTRKIIAGTNNTIFNAQFNTNINGSLFGNNAGAGFFSGAINANNIYISKALSIIPFTGEVIQTHYDGFLEEFQRAFPNGGFGPAVTTRLLAMKRPDYFVSPNGANAQGIIAIFGPGITVHNYWNQVVEVVRQMNWWNSPEPHIKSTYAYMAWKCRAAMLDTLIYRG